MANLRQEYVDRKDVKHHVEHFSAPKQEPADREQIVQELFLVLTKSSKKIPA